MEAGLFKIDHIRRAGGNIRSMAGREARLAGKSFEKLIMMSQRDSRGQVVNLVQIENAAKRIKRKGADKTELIEAKSAFDFFGGVVGSGLLIAFDAKRCSPETSALAVNNPKVVKPHQLNELERLEATPAISGFLIQCEAEKVYLWLAASKARSNKPIHWNDSRFLEIGQVQVGHGVPLRALIDHYQRASQLNPPKVAGKE